MAMRSSFRLAPLLLAGFMASLAQASTPDNSYRLLMSPTKSGRPISVDSLQAASKSAKFSSLILNRTYTGRPVDVYSVSLTTEIDASALCEVIASISGATFCEVDAQATVHGSPSRSPNDPLYDQQWALKAMNVPKVWAAGYKGDSSIKVCVIDSGIDHTHPDLAANMWLNTVEASAKGSNASNGYQNSVDDDGNGITDDIYGATFLDGAVSGNTADDNGHGTFVAGVIGAVGNNSLGVTGVNQNTSLIACKFSDATGNGWVSDAIQCVDYCLSKDAHILAAAWGGMPLSNALQASIKSVEAAGALFVTSAGSDGTDLDKNPSYPASLQSSNLLTVGASDETGKLWKGSNYGTTVQIVAPGVSILGTGLEGTYVKQTGTSMSAAHVAGAAALILQQFAAKSWAIDAAGTGEPGLGALVKALIVAQAQRNNTTRPTGGILDVDAASKLVGMMPSVTKDCAHVHPKPTTREPVL